MIGLGETKTKFKSFQPITSLIISISKRLSTKSINQEIVEFSPIVPSFATEGVLPK
jgi:hypothetical protein